jgi:hypothetical protein
MITEMMDPGGYFEYMVLKDESLAFFERQLDDYSQEGWMVDGNLVIANGEYHILLRKWKDEKRSKTKAG